MKISEIISQLRRLQELYGDKDAILVMESHNKDVSFLCSNAIYVEFNDAEDSVEIRDHPY